MSGQPAECIIQLFLDFVIGRATRGELTVTESQAIVVRSAHVITQGL